MEKEPLIRLTWHGHETITVIPKLLDEAEEIEIALPLDYNHSLFHALHPDARPADLEDIDAQGGPELLARVATVSGLNELAQLVEVLKQVQASIRVSSPPTILITVPNNKPDSK